MLGNYSFNKIGTSERVECKGENETWKPGDLCTTCRFPGDSGDVTLWKEFYPDKDAGSLSATIPVDFLPHNTVCIILSTHTDDVAKQHKLRYTCSLLFVLARGRIGYVWDIYLKRIP